MNANYTVMTWELCSNFFFLFLFSDVKVEKELKLIGCSVMYSQSLVADFDDVLTHHQIFPSLVSKSALLPALNLSLC